jgi:hypothetical protein
MREAIGVGAPRSSRHTLTGWAEFKTVTVPVQLPLAASDLAFAPASKPGAAIVSAPMLFDPNQSLRVRLRREGRPGRMVRREPPFLREPIRPHGSGDLVRPLTGIAVAGQRRIPTGFAEVRVSRGI